MYNMDANTLSLDFLEDEYIPGECSDNSADEEELNRFLMKELEEPRKSKNTFADRLTAKIMKRKNKKKNRETFFLGHRTKKKKKKKTASDSSKLDPMSEKLLQEATDLYLNKKFDEAVKILKELVTRAQGVHDPFHMLGLIYQNEFNDMTTATNYYLLAAHLVPTDKELWQRIGEMSQESGNLGQAIYCFKKCQRDHEGEVNEQAVFALAICYVEKKDYANAAKMFGILFQLHPDDKVIAKELAKCFQLMGDLHSSLLVLTAYFNLTFDSEMLETILELNVNLGMYEECLKILDDLCSTNKIEPKKLPMEHLVYYVVSRLNVDKEVKAELDHLYESELSVNYIFLIANNLCAKHLEESVRWFKRAYSRMQSVQQLDVQTTLKISKCLITDSNHHDFMVDVLKSALETSPNDSEVLITLADVLVQKGNLDEADELIARLTLNDLDKIKDIPEQIPEEERVEILRKLNEQVAEIDKEFLSDPKKRMYPCLLSYKGSKKFDPKKINEWVDTFLRVVRDCELDTERAIQRFNRSKLTRPNQDEFSQSLGRDENSIFIANDSKRTSTTKTYSFLKVKRELNLRSVEDILGWAGYERLIFTAAVFMCLCNRVKEAVEVMEMIANNKKRYKSNLDIVERKSLIRTIEKIIYKCSSFGGLFKIAVTCARNEFLRDPVHGSLEGYARILGTGKMAHAALHPLSSSNEREALLENRAWVTRQLLQYPDNFQLLMLGGHFCTISGNWAYANHEYKRAFQKNQSDSLASLCLATSYFNSLNSRTTDSLNKSVVLGMTFLQKYVDLRTNWVQLLNLPERCNLVFKAERMYNIARAYHFMKMFNMAVPLYEECLELVSSIQDADESRDRPVDCPCILCDYCRNSGKGLPSSCRGFTVPTFVTNHAKLQVQRSAAYNLALIHLQNNNLLMANYISSKYIVWK